jgi:acetyl esterase/lipase
MLPGTDAIYKHAARSQKWKANTVKLQHGAKGHWLGHSDAKYVLVYFHGKSYYLAEPRRHDQLISQGGGYIAPCTPGHMKYQFALQKYLRKQGIDISVLSLSYILAPHAVHPSFIQQGLSALQYLIEKTHRDPSTILLGGDSAGANLVANLLLHLGHPHPDCTPYTLSKKLKGALLISPWVSFETTNPSFERNKKSDYLTKTALDKASAAFIGPDAKHDAYSQPIDAPAEWWSEVSEKVVEDVLVWGGGGEVLIDGITEFAGNVVSGFEDLVAAGTEKVAKDGVPNGTVEGVDKAKVEKRVRAKFVISPNEAHEEMIINYLFYFKREDDGGKQVKKWLVDVLKRKRDVTSEPTAAEVREQVTEKFAGVADNEKTIEKAEETQEKRELVEEEEKKAENTEPAIESVKGIADAVKTIEKAEEWPGNRELVEAEKKKAAQAVAPIA